MSVWDWIALLAQVKAAIRAAKETGQIDVPIRGIRDGGDTWDCRIVGTRRPK